MTSARRILWITTRWPLPATDGASQASCAGIQQLSSKFEIVDLLSFAKTKISSQEIQSAKTILGVKEVRLAYTKQTFGRFSRVINAVRSFINPFSIPFTYFPFQDQGLLRLLEGGTTESYTHVVFDGLHTATTLLGKGARIKKSKLKYIYRAHNVESSLWFQSASRSNLPLKLLILNQAKKVRKFEQTLLSISSAIATVSAEDLNKFAETYQLPESKVIPIGFDFEENPSTSNNQEKEADTKLLFLGGISWRPNKEGLVWFLENVWPAVTSNRKDISLTIAGRGTEALRSRFENLPNIKILGEVGNLENLYSEANASIVPIFFGSGTRVKAIEAGRFQRACISTAIGIEGLPLTADKSYLNAETAEDWISLLTNLSNENLERLGREAFKSLRISFDKRQVAQEFIELLDSI